MHNRQNIRQVPWSRSMYRRCLNSSSTYASCIIFSGTPGVVTGKLFNYRNITTQGTDKVINVKYICKGAVESTSKSSINPEKNTSRKTLKVRREWMLKWLTLNTSCPARLDLFQDTELQVLHLKFWQQQLHHRSVMGARKQLINYLWD